MGLELFLFLALGFLAIVGAALMIISKNAVHSALFLILNFGCVALLFLMLDAPFISMVQIAVYAGAIMVLFLFVIMLLGAEQTTDTEARTFGWISGVATVLTASFLFAMAIPFVLSGGVDLPDAPGEDPVLRVVHTANVTDAVDVTLAGDALEDPVVIDDIFYGDFTDFVSVPEGDYTVTLSTDSATALETTLTLSPDDQFTVVAYGEDAVELVLVPFSFDATNQDSARVIVANLYTDAPVTLVDKGANRRLDVDGESITDRVIVSDLALGDISDTIALPEGDYDLGFYVLDGRDWVEIRALDDYMVEAGTEQPMLFVGDYAATPDTSGEFRSRVLYSGSGDLNIKTADGFGSPGDIGLQLFTTYLLPVNLVGFLLLVALVGVIVLTRPMGITTEKRSTRNRRRKVSRPLVNVISQQTGQDVVVGSPRLEDGSGD